MKAVMPNRQSKLAWVLAPLAALAVAVPALAQEAAAPAKTALASTIAAATFRAVQTPTGPPPLPRHTGIVATLKAIPHDFTHLTSKWNVLWVGVGGGLALAVHPSDAAVNRHLAGEGNVHTFFLPGKHLSGVALAGTTATIYAVGRLADKPKVSHLGMDLIRALAVNQVLTEVIKHSVHRPRPDGTDNLSFPSGHASSTFAFATALERHLSWRFAVPAYVFASYVASSRLHDNRHYLSDVVFGATIGIISGRTVTRHGRTNFSLAVVPTRGGAAFVVSRAGK
jgi:membrane-associated phospholipid phosphatase